MKIIIQLTIIIPDRCQLKIIILLAIRNEKLLETRILDSKKSQSGNLLSKMLFLKRCVFCYGVSD